MDSSARSRSVAIVGVGAVLPDAADAAVFWRNLLDGRSSIREVPRDRWNPDLYYDADPRAPDRTYSKIGGWVTDYEWDPLGWRMPIPPKVAAAMDPTQKYAIAAARQALLDYGYPERPLDGERTAVILGNAMGGDHHLLTSARILFPEMAEELLAAPAYRALPADVRTALLEELRAGVGRRIPDITEDTMPGELSNITAGRIAALYDFRGPNFVTDAACASAMAALYAAIDGLENGDYDAVLSGGADANMSPSAFVKFCKIGALSATGSRPYAEGADGFVMGEGSVVFVLKRLADAERDGDRVYAVIRGVGGSSDGRGKGITAPNPVGQQLAVQRAWANAGLAPRAGDLIEGHGTSTRVGDVVEVTSMNEVFAGAALAPGSLMLGSVKSNIGHLKGAAGAVGMLKAALSLHHGVVPASINFARPNPGIDFARATMAVSAETTDWPRRTDGTARRAGLSAFGFGGTNFHVVMEEYVPGAVPRTQVRGAGAGDTASVGTATAGGATSPAAGLQPSARPEAASPGAPAPPLKAPLRGALVIGGRTEAEIAGRLKGVKAEAERGIAPPPAPPARADLDAPIRLAVDYGDAAELADLAGRTLAALEAGDAGRWRALRNKGVFLGRGTPGKVAFLFTGQGSQYVNMLRELRDVEAIVAETFAEADEVMGPLIGGTLTSRIFIDDADEAALAAAEDALKQTAVTQPAVLAVDTSLARLMEAYGIAPDLLMGHSLGEYGALVAAGAMSFGDALKAVSARGDAMTHLAMEDNGLMAAVFGDVERVREVIEGVDGYVVIANLNSTKECVIGGATAAVEAAMEALREAGMRAQPLPVSHAFHTEIVAHASEPLIEVLKSLSLRAPSRPVVANVDGELYPSGDDAVVRMHDILGRQVGSPVQFVKGLGTLYDAGARVFVEMGPKRVLYGFADDVLADRDDVVALFTNQPRNGDIVSFNRALCGLYAAGLGAGTEALQATLPPTPPAAVEATAREAALAPAPSEPDRYSALGRMFADFLERSFETWAGGRGPRPVRVGITGAALGLPGGERVFEERNLERILSGEALIRAVPQALRDAMAARQITRLVKGTNGEASFETIDDPADVIKLAGRGGELDLVEEYGFPADRLESLDRVTRLAIAAGLDALRDAGIPLVMRHKTTTTGSKLPDGWALPEPMRDDTGVIFASAFPGLDSFARIIEGYHEDRARRERLEELHALRAKLAATGAVSAVPEVDARIATVEAELEANPFRFDRRFLFQVLNMGHAQFAEHIGARGPNIGTNGACASSTQATALARDWIAAGRCRRVIVLSADDITTDTLLPWFGAGFLASGAAATDERLEDAALPFDRRRHGLIMGMGGAALVVESLDAAAERGLAPVCEVLGTVVANSAFHGSRLDVQHIAAVMERLVSDAEREWGIDRRQIAGETVFVSHETYTPARGGSASAEVVALRRVFGDAVDRIVVANTKGHTGHPMAVGIEDALAVRMLETGVIPPVANFREVDPELGMLNLSRGGSQPVRYALRLGAGFGSQIAMSLLRWTPPPDGARRAPNDVGFRHRIVDRGAWERWLAGIAGAQVGELEVVRRVLRVRSGSPDRGERVTPPLDVTSTVITPATAAQAPTSNAAPPPPLPEPVRERVLGIVAEQTGYPPDMLDLDLDLEADLGIDTVKQAEMFVAIREEYGIERDENLALREYPTLKRAIEFVYEKRPDLAPAVNVLAAPVPTTSGAPTTDGVPASSVPPSTPPQQAPDPVRASILRIVTEQTGYPEDMLDLDLDLEADLGIDTVKQAEMFAAIREEYGIERDENLALREYPTLKRAIEFVYEKRPDLAAAPAPAATAAPAPEAEAPQPQPSEGGAAMGAPAAAPGASTPALAAGDMAAAQAMPRRIPVARLRPATSFFRDTGVALGEGDRVVVVDDAAGVGRSLVARLQKRGVTTLVVDDAPSADVLAARLTAWHADGPVRGLYWLPALDVVDDATLRDPVARREAVRARVRLLYTTLRTLYDGLGAAGTFVLTATRLGGRHGYDEEGAADVLGGAVAGLTKSFARERPDALVKAVDFAPGARAAELADVLIDETLRDGGAVEVGHALGRRWTVGLEERPVEPGSALPGRNGVWVVTGAAGSITSAILGDVAAGGGEFWLLDLTPEPDASDPDLARLSTDRDGLRRDVFARLNAAGERATPALVEKELAKLERSAAALAAIRAVEAAGGTAHWRAVDLRDADAVGAVMSEVVRSRGRVDVLVHAAGLEISRALPDKSPQEFDLVFDVKTEGWFNVLAGLGDAELGAAVVFSSIAGRFGNAGQADYSAANDLLCKAVSSFRNRRPDARGVAVDWTAWGGIGMASRGSIPAIMKSAGIDMLEPAAGIPVVRRELSAGVRGEVVIAGSLGVMLEERIAAGGVEHAVADGAGPMTGRIAGFGVHEGLVVETLLDPGIQPFLDDHRIDGIAVLPGVMGIEAMVEAACLPFPGLRVAAVEDVRFLAPFKFYRDEPRTVTVRVHHDLAGDDVLADCVLLGTRTLHGRPEPEVTAHFVARVRLTSSPADPPTSRALPPAAETIGADAIYDVYFHGPAYRVLGEAWRAGNAMVGRLASRLPPNHQPATLATLASPRLIELAFQTAGLVEIADAARMGLPHSVDSVVPTRHGDGDLEGAAALLLPGDPERGHDLDVVAANGTVLLSIRGYRTAALQSPVAAGVFPALRAGA